MAADKRQPDPLVLTASGGTTIAPGSALARLQTVAEDPEAELLVGDLKDTLAYAQTLGIAKPPRAVGEAGQRLTNIIKDKLKGEKVIVNPADITTLTAFLLKPVPEPSPAEETAPARVAEKTTK